MLGLLSVVAAAIGFPAWAVGGLAVLALALVAVAVRLLAFPPRLLTLTADHYAVHNIRGNPTASAAWADVASVSTRDIAGSAAVVIELADGRTSFVPVGLLGSRAVEAQREIHERLNNAHGYRRLNEG